MFGIIGEKSVCEEEAGIIILSDKIYDADSCDAACVF